MSQIKQVWTNPLSGEITMVPEADAMEDPQSQDLLDGITNLLQSIRALDGYYRRIDGLGFGIPRSQIMGNQSPARNDPSLETIRDGILSLLWMDVYTVMDNEAHGGGWSERLEENINCSLLTGV
jgi:hypothetical protein